MRRDLFARCSSARDLVVLTAVAVALLLPAPALATVHSDLTGIWDGFALSAVDPRFHPRMVLRVDRHDEDEFFGTLLMGTPGGELPFTFKGDVFRDGAFDGKGTGAAGEVKFTGVVWGLGGGAAKAVANYKFIFPDGTQDQGQTILLRSFAQPTDPVVPVITGDWRGNLMSHLTGGQMTANLNITEQVGTSFDGTGQVSGAEPEPFMFVGTIGPGGSFRVVVLGVGDGGFVWFGGEVGAAGIPGDNMAGTYLRNFVTGVVDFGTFMLSPPLR